MLQFLGVDEMMIDKGCDSVSLLKSFCTLVIKMSVSRFVFKQLSQDQLYIQTLLCENALKSLSYDKMRFQQSELHKSDWKVTVFLAPNSSPPLDTVSVTSCGGGTETTDRKREFCTKKPEVLEDIHLIYLTQTVEVSY